MNRSVSHFLTLFGVFLVSGGPPAAAQSFESVGERALGMGGAFVAVANDSSATWWNPAGLATGPFLDVSIGRVSGTADTRLPASRSSVWSIALATPPLGVSYYRLHITDIRPFVPTGEPDVDRQDGAAGLGVRSISVSQFGATVLHTITTGVTAGATVKFLRGTANVRQVDSSGELQDLLDFGDDLDGGEGEGAVDVDLGILATVGAMRLGLTGRNLAEPDFAGRELPRQIRAGLAFDGEAAGWTPVVVSLDVDLRRYAAGNGDRRAIAVGAEHWLRPRRVAVRAGGRFNTVGEQEQAVTAGATVAVRAGLFVEGHAAYGSDASERGWGLAARVSF